MESSTISPAAGRAVDAPTLGEALRRTADAVEHERAERAARQRDYLRWLPDHADLDILASDEMWR